MLKHYSLDSELLFISPRCGELRFAKYNWESL